MNRKKALKILGFSPSDNPSEYEIRKAYRKLALEYHPDKHSSASEDVQKYNEEKFKELGAAYDLLTGKDTEEVTKLTDENLDEINSPEDLKFYLYEAISEGNTAFLKKLFSKFKSSKDGKFGDYINDNIYAYPALILAIKEGGNIEIIKLFLENGANCDTQDKQGCTALHKACNKCYNEIIELLLERGADPNKRDQEGKSPLHYAIYSCCGIARHKAVELLLGKGAHLNMQDNQGKASLHYLCSGHFFGGSVEIAKLLLKKGADPGLKDKDGKKPVDCVAGASSDAGEMFGAINYEKAFWIGCATLLTTAGSIALISGVADAYIGKVWCSTLAVGMAAVALCSACCAIKIMFFSRPSTEFTEARAEFLNSQSPNPAGAA
ncbi:ankyrin repeat domain-containing protein [Wolbachia endosymbiont (group A) of Hedychridium roseum]|uniref:ankyrin repeat domain-containing protein n=1 Tax=Wolbachia endosymbiont (group A) of Hedychridium roseum TaxID=3077921 RepID=UPI00333F373A